MIILQYISLNAVIMLMLEVNSQQKSNEPGLTYDDSLADQGLKKRGMLLQKYV